MEAAILSSFLLKMKSITLDVFGRRVLVVRSEDKWSVFYLGNEGKRRLATDIFVPASVTECQLEQFVCGSVSRVGVRTTSPARTPRLTAFQNGPKMAANAV